VFIEFKKSAIKFLEKLNKKEQTRIITSVEKIPQGDIAPLHGKKITVYRLRVGKYRIIFTIENNIAIVADIDSRGDVYK